MLQIIFFEFVRVKCHYFQVKVGKNTQVKVGENTDKLSLEPHYYLEGKLHLWNI